MPNNRDTRPAAVHTKPRPSAASARVSPRVIGLAGGIAAGKSTVAAMFERFGARVIDADAIARDALDSKEVREKLQRHWGAGMFDGAGEPDRAKIAEIAFKDPDKLRELTAWVHPPTLRRMRTKLERALRDSAVPLVIIDAPLLIEADLDAWCDAVVFVEAEPALRAERARSARGWSQEEIHRRESAQSPLAEKRQRADVIVDNSGSSEETRAQVARLFHKWVQRSPSSENKHRLGGKNNG